MSILRGWPGSNEVSPRNARRFGVVLLSPSTTVISQRIKPQTFRPARYSHDVYDEDGETHDVRDEQAFAVEARLELWDSKALGPF